MNEMCGMAGDKELGEWHKNRRVAAFIRARLGQSPSLSPLCSTLQSTAPCGRVLWSLGGRMQRHFLGWTKSFSSGEGEITGRETVILQQTWCHLHMRGVTGIGYTPLNMRTYVIKMTRLVGNSSEKVYHVMVFFVVKIFNSNSRLGVTSTRGCYS